MLTAAQLHGHLRESLSPFAAEGHMRGLRALLEQGGAESFLRDLLFIRLCAEGHLVSREFPLGDRCAVDLVVHGDATLHIEIKQLHLKDGCRFAPGNLAKDLARHGTLGGLGVLFLADERASTLAHARSAYGGANRRAAHDAAAVVSGMATHFKSIWPALPDEAILREFSGDGMLRLYGFIVTL